MSTPVDPGALIMRPKRKATRHPVENAVTKARRAAFAVVSVRIARCCGSRRRSACALRR